MTQTSLPEAAEAPAGTRPLFTITEAATACAVSRKTITRKLAELAEAGAAKDADGIWRIPVEALLAVGLHPGRSLAPSPAGRTEPLVDLRAARPPAPAETAAGVEMVTVSRDRWDDLRIRLARAEAESVERGRALDDARLALRALTAGPAVPVVDRLGEAAVAPTPTAPATRHDRQDLPRTRDVIELVEEGAGSGLPPTPVPMTLGADSSVWDTLLPMPPAAVGRTAGEPSPAAEPIHVAVPGVGAYPAAPPLTPISVSGPTTHSAVVDSLPRRRWWGGKR